MRRMLQEARLFASISNPHIIRYNHSWVEVDDCSETAPVEAPDTESASALSIELESPFIEFAEPSKESAAEESSKAAESSGKGQSKVSKISLYIQMELCRETLEDYINKRQFPLTEDEFNKSLEIAQQLIEGINVLHSEHKVIHRDLSLRNVFIGKDNTVKLGDFGLATKCRNLVPILASPLICKPRPSDEETLDFFSLEDSSLDEPELTHGLGTKTFAAPEQMSNLPYDQKADIYSLGLIFLALFYPTQTLSERQEILWSCRAGSLPKELLEEHPEIAGLIRRMTSADSEVRPTGAELARSSAFYLRKRSASNNWSKLNITEKKYRVKLEMAEKFKERYIKIIGDTLLLYKSMNEKAKLCYPLQESSIISYGADSRQIRRINGADLNEDLSDLGSFSKIVIEHPQLETLEVAV
eukprot:TRINITY_DN9501_c0_g1_i2.p1 TRINITY_DN9501_c0_g1~~TRINITY_DN9501_c0_g1_i2.p1  ORF type:complete len:414 (-),score=109.00 TRINITY_DN9501_c0_g1_i2:115-1356(-)